MEEQNTSTRLWTIEEVAKYLQVKPSAVRRWVYEQSIRFNKIGRLVRFKPDELMEDLKQNRIGKIVAEPITDRKTAIL